MKCYNHPDRDAVAYCSVCGRALCKECCDKHSPIMCDGCFEDEQRRLKEEAESEAQENERRERQIEKNMKRGFIETTVFMVLGLLLGYGISRVVFWFGAEMMFFWYFILFFLPFSYYGITMKFDVRGCFFTVLKYLVCWILGPLFYLYQLVKTAHQIRTVYKNSSKGLLLEFGFILINVLLVYYLFNHLFNIVWAAR